MFRKFAFAVVAAAALGFAALAPTTASAGGGRGHGHGHGHGHHGWHGGGWHHGHHHHWRGPRFAFGGPTYYGNNGCYVRRLVPTPWGPRWRTINRCF